jgi:hypothetical protein
MHNRGPWDSYMRTSLSIHKVAYMCDLLGTGEIVERVLTVKPCLPYLR